jgi:adenylate cyclase class 2
MEDNWVLDDTARTLATAGRLLRVRRFGDRSFLTLKGPATFSAGVKSRVETETVRRYQKRRETWSLEGVTVALDETPMGAFVELEGESARLASVASALGLDPRTSVRGTYLDLWTAYRAEHPDAPQDMVFST